MWPFVDSTLLCTSVQVLYTHIHTCTWCNTYCVNENAVYTYKQSESAEKTATVLKTLIRERKIVTYMRTHTDTLLSKEQQIHTLMHVHLPHSLPPSLSLSLARHPGVLFLVSTLHIHVCIYTCCTVRVWCIGSGFPFSSSSTNLLS